LKGTATWSGSLETSRTTNRTARSASATPAKTRRPPACATSRWRASTARRARVAALLCLGLLLPAGAASGAPGTKDTTSANPGTASTQPLRGIADGRLSPRQLRALRLRQWYRVDAPGVTVFSNGNLSQLRAASLELARFRAGVLALLGLRAADLPSHPLQIFLLRSSTTRALIGGDTLLGYMMPGLRNHRIVATLLDRGRVLGSRNIVMLHEYVHFLLRSGSSFRYPAWYDEGIAELLSTAQPTKQGLAFGAIPLNAAALLYRRTDRAQRARPETAPLTVADLVGYTPGPEPGVRDLTRGPQFYGRAWQLAHYLLFGPEDQRAALSAYLRAYDGGEPGISAFERSFSISTSAVDRALAAYRPQDHTFELAVPNIELPGESTVALTPSQARQAAAALLEDVAPATVLDWFPSATDLERTPATIALTARARAALGNPATARQDLNDALEKLGRHHELLLARAAIDLAACRGQGTTGGCADRTMLAQIAADAREAYELAPNLAETQVRYGEALLRGARPDLATPLLESARRQIPTSYTVLRELGVAYLNQGQWNRAATLLERAAAWSTDNPDARARIESLLLMARSRQLPSARQNDTSDTELNE
jgi:tetratricopeptide (TPR) repeat protein